MSKSALPEKALKEVQSWRVAGRDSKERIGQSTVLGSVQVEP